MIRLFCLILWACHLSTALAAGDPELGRRIYLDGVLPSGSPVQALTRGDLLLTGQRASCAACHRPSGFGSSEGATYVPPITAPFLFTAGERQRADLFRKLFQEVQTEAFRTKVRAPTSRPAYTPASITHLLTHGEDPAGRIIDPIMPRYQFSPQDAAHLNAYLQQLGAQNDPGVDNEKLHFAVVITSDAPVPQSEAMLQVLNAYTDRKNRDTTARRSRPGFSPYFKDDFESSWREWVLNIWRLEGSPGSWSQQLADYYHQQPVFALLSGIAGPQGWEPVHQFAESKRIPTLFPHTNQPGLGPNHQSLYLSKGLALEAQTLARHIHQNRARINPNHLVMVSQGPQANTLAHQFREALGQFGLKLRKDITIDPQTDWDQLLFHHASGALILWLDDPNQLPHIPAPPRAIFMSGSLTGLQTETPLHWQPRLQLTWPYTTPGKQPPRLFRLRAWLRSRRIPVTHESIQLHTYFALSVADHSLNHLVDHFSRDYFIELAEHECENGLNPGIYPRLTLGPGQRYANKGAYIITQIAPGQWLPTGDRIIP